MDRARNHPLWLHHASGWESCSECRFDGSAYTDNDLLGSLRLVGDWFAEYCVGLDDTAANQRPEPTSWSIGEYARHTKRVLWTMAALAELSLDAADHEVSGSPPPPASADDAFSPPIDLDREFRRIAEEANRLIVAVRDSARRDGAGPGPGLLTVNGEPADAGGIARHALHEAMHHLSDIGRTRHGLGAGTPQQAGSITAIRRSRGGVPKSAIDSVGVGYRGVEGDRQGNRIYHGRVWQAVCLWSADVIDELAAEGHPIGPGDAGENIVVRGLAWDSLILGTRMAFAGDHGPLLELTDWATPCTKIRRYFSDGDSGHIDVARHRGRSRVYAKVLRDGVITVGDSVRIV